MEDKGIINIIIKYVYEKTSLTIFQRHLLYGSLTSHDVRTSHMEISIHILARKQPKYFTNFSIGIISWQRRKKRQTSGLNREKETRGKERQTYWGLRDKDNHRSQSEKDREKTLWQFQFSHKSAAAS